MRGHEIVTDGQTDILTDRQTDRWTDGQPVGQGDYYRALPTSYGGALMRKNLIIIKIPPFLELCWALDKREYLVIHLLISHRNRHMLWPLIWTVLRRRFRWGVTTYGFMEILQKIIPNYHQIPPLTSSSGSVWGTVTRWKDHIRQTTSV